MDHLLDRYADTELALAAYHAGQGNVDRWRREGRGIAFPETRAYVDEVVRLRRVYRQAYPSELVG
jgi:soluble lytic murein transglycosylase-like protein